MLENGCHIPYTICVGYKNMPVISTLSAVPDDVLITGIHCQYSYIRYVLITGVLVSGIYCIRLLQPNTNDDKIRVH